MNDSQRKTPDVVSVIAGIGAPTFVLVRFVTGNWTTRAFYLLCFMIVGVFYWLVVMRTAPTSRNMPESDDSPSEIDSYEPNTTKASPIVMTTVAGAYILILALCSVAGYLRSN